MMELIRYCLDLSATCVLLGILFFITKFLLEYMVDTKFKGIKKFHYFTLKLLRDISLKIHKVTAKWIARTYEKDTNSSAQ
jgi:hypothetical protein